jgi:hypothetical protein
LGGFITEILEIRRKRASEVDKWLSTYLLSPYNDLAGWLEEDLLEALGMADPLTVVNGRKSGAQIQNDNDFQSFLIHLGGRLDAFTDTVISDIQSQTPLFYEMGLGDGASFVADQLEVQGQDDLDLLGLILADPFEYDITRWDPYGPGWNRWKSVIPTTLNAVRTDVPASVGRSIRRNPADAALRSFRSILGKVAGWFTGMGNMAMWGSYVEAILGLARKEPYLSDWLWVAQLDTKTCPSCIALHGTRHPFYEEFYDHPHGRCIPVPLVTELPLWVGDRDYEIRNPNVGSGEEWFSLLDSQVQKDILGPAMFNAWQAGAVSLQDMSVITDNPAYGRIARRASLVELLGDGAGQFYES